MNYDFPGNVRELENIIERGVALESSNIILPESLTLSLHRKGKQEKHSTSWQDMVNEEELFEEGLEKVLADIEKTMITHALEKANFSKMKAAELLKISFRSMRYKVKKYQMDT